MAVARPPIDSVAWDEHQTAAAERETATAMDGLAQARQQQDAVRQQTAAAEQEDFTRDAQQQLSDALAPARQAQESASFVQEAEEQVRALTRSVPTPGGTADNANPPSFTGRSQTPATRDQYANQSTGLSRVYQDALASGLDDEGARAAVAVARTEGGMEGSVGDAGVSAGTFQLHHAGGMGNAYAQSQGVSTEESIARLRQDPHAANRWALGGYLGQAIKRGQAQGLRGADLATYAQREGQRSVAPERAGANYAAAQGELGDPSAGGVADSSLLGAPPSPGAESRQYGAARGPSRAEALGQFEQGLDYATAASICGPVAALAFVQANGRNPSLAEVRALAVKRGWTEAGGMNGVANEQALLNDLGVASRLDTSPDFGEIAADAASGNPVVVSTPVHYYFINGFDSNTGRLHVGKTGTSRKGGGSWMSAQDIANLDGGINGVLYVDNPQSPQPSVAVSSGDTSGERPPSELEAPSRFGPGADVARGLEKGYTGQPDAVVEEAPDERPPFAPDRPPMGMEGLLNLGPFGVRTPTLPPVVPPNLAPPDEEEQRRVQRGEAPVQDVEALAGKIGGFLGRQVQSQPGAIAETVIPDAQDVVRAQEARGGYGGGVGGDLVRGVGEVVGGGLGDIPAVGKKAAGAVERLRLDKFPEEVRDTIQRAAEEGDFWRTQRRGVIPDERAEQMADRLGRSVDDLIARSARGRAYNTEETRALRNAVTAQAMTVNELAEEIARAPHEAGPGLIARSVAEGMKLADLTRIAEGGRAEAGRALRAYAGFARDYAASPAGAIERIQKAVGGPEQAAKAIAEYHKMILDGAGPAQMAAFWARAEKPPVGALEWWELLRRNSMLSGPRTMVINALSGGTEVPWKLAGDTLESVLRGRPGEVVPEVKAIWAGLRRGSENAVQTLAHGITDEAAKAGDLPRDVSSRLTNPVAKRAALALEAPMRGQQATDEVVQGVAYSMHLARDAALTASKEGLKGTAWNERVADLIANPSADAMKRASSGADAMTFKGEMGNLGQALGKFQQVPIIGPMVLPFLRTVYHITARGIDRSPLGAIGTGIDVARGVYRGGKELPKGVRPLGERFRDNAMGSAASVWFYDQALQGNITGAGPDDPEKRAMLQAQGWQPYAVKLGGTYVGYQNWGPIAVPLALMAGAAEAQTYAKPGATTGEQVGDALQRSVKVLTEQNYLQGVGAIYKSMTDFDRYGHQWLTQYLTSLVPYGAAVNTLGQATDPLVRQPEKGDVAGALAGRFPGLREDLPAKRDVLGRDVVNEQQGLAAANPLRTTEGRPDETLRVLLDNNADIGAPPKEVRNVPLAPADQRRHQEIAGGLIADTVGKITADPRFADLPAEIRTKILRGAVERARSAAAGILFGEIGSLELSRRMREKTGAAR